MANVRGKSIDNTHLSIDTAENRILIHRDYIAHVFRWTYVARELGRNYMYKKAVVLDIGCGVDLPLARMLYSNRYIVDNYIGLEYNKSSKLKTGMFENGKFPLSVYGGVDFASNKQVNVRAPEFEGSEEYGGACLYVDGDEIEGEHPIPNVFTAFEMLEHIEPSHSRAVLEKIHRLMAISALNQDLPPVAYISTPCYSATVGAADNHVNEMRRDALGAVIEDIGFAIEANYGTFASQRDYRDNLLSNHPELRWLWEGLNEYYDSNVLANIFAPIVPRLSRNNIWKLRLGREDYVRKFPSLVDVPQPWTSSTKWEQLTTSEHYKG